MVDNFLRKRSEKIICYCVSQKPDSHILWDRYGNGLAGFCLEFTSSAKFFNDVYPVEYKPELPSTKDIYNKMCDILTQIALRDNPDIYLRELHQITVCTKLIHYQQEYEWRVTHERTKPEFDNKTQLYPIENGDIVSIILGEKIQQEDKKLLQSIMSHKYKNQPLQLKIAKVGANSSIIIEPFSFD